jgi:hypothetical protein
LEIFVSKEIEIDAGVPQADAEIILSVVKTKTEADKLLGHGELYIKSNDGKFLRVIIGSPEPNAQERS